MNTFVSTSSALPLSKSNVHMSHLYKEIEQNLNVFFVCDYYTHGNITIFPDLNHVGMF